MVKDDNKKKLCTHLIRRFTRKRREANELKEKLKVEEFRKRIADAKAMGTYLAELLLLTLYSSRLLKASPRALR
jgi:hypothetical protein